MNDKNSSEPSEVAKNSLDNTNAGPTKITIGGLSSPFKVKKGGTLVVPVTAVLQTGNGGAFSGDPGEGTWTATASPPAGGIQGQSAYKLNGNITISNVQNSHTVTIRVVSRLYGLSATKTIEVVTF